MFVINCPLTCWLIHCFTWSVEMISSSKEHHLKYFFQFKDFVSETTIFKGLFFYDLVSSWYMFSDNKWACFRDLKVTMHEVNRICLQDIVSTGLKQLQNTCTYWKYTVIPRWNCQFTAAQCVFVHVWGLYTVCQLIMYNSFLCPMCASPPLSPWPDNLHLSLLVLRLSSPILPSLFPSVHPWESLFIHGDGVGPTCLCLSMQACAWNAHRRAHTHILCVRHPFTWLNASILWLQIDRWLDRWTDDPWWSLSLRSLSLTCTHTDRHTQYRFPTGLLQKHKHVFRTHSFFSLLL